jgi:hypothetical protein
MSTDLKESDSPSDRVVSMARTWLVTCGVVCVALGIALHLSDETGWGAAIASFGLANFLAARYASGRVAVFIAWLGV